MNDFGEMSITGAVLSNAEMRELRLKRGECETCGQKCFKKSLFKQTPITIHGRVLNGRCLICQPLEADEMEVLPAEVNFASTRDVARASKSAPWSSTGNLCGVQEKANEEDPSMFRSNRDLNTASQRRLNESVAHTREQSLLNRSESHNFNRDGKQEETEAKTLNLVSDGSDESQRSLSYSGEAHQFNPQNIFSGKSLSSRKPSYVDSETDTSAQSSRRGFFSISSKKNFWGSQASLNTQPSLPTKQSKIGFVEDSKPSLGGSQQLKALEDLDEQNLSVEDILLTATKFPQSKTIQEKAMYLLANATHNITESELDNLKRQIDDIRIIMEVMDFFPSEQKLQFDCCSTLRNLCTLSEDMQVFIAQNGGVNCIIHSMETFSENALLQQTAIETLTKMGQHDENLLTILKRGGHKCIIDAMVKHNDNFNVIDLGCDGIVNLAANDYSFKTSIVDQGGADQIIIATVVFSEKVEFIKKCFSALRILCVGHDSNKYEIVKKGAVDSVVSMMQLYKHDIEIQECGARTLYELGSITETSQIIGESGGIDMLLRALWIHSQDKCVKLECCLALEVLSSNPQNLFLMFEIGTIPAVINAMQEATEICRLQAASCAILANLAATGKEVKINIVQEEALDAIMIAMVLYKNVGILQHNACRVLNNLICDENLDAIQAANAPELMNVAAFNFPSECDAAARAMVETLETSSRI